MNFWRGYFWFISSLRLLLDSAGNFGLFIFTRFLVLNREKFFLEKMTRVFSIFRFGDECGLGTSRIQLGL